VVRHPIYAGLLIAALATAALQRTPIAFIGFFLLAWSYKLKAELEERFLAEQLGPGQYDEYRKRTPMLVPFWPSM
jgi:protein-S-isoprenylcysteine O-methyltransferase Ste14